MKNRSNSGRSSSGVAPRCTDTTPAESQTSDIKGYPDVQDGRSEDSIAEPAFRADISAARFTYEAVNHLEDPEPLENPTLPQGQPDTGEECKHRPEPYDSVTLYLNRIGKVPLLSAEQEIELARAAANGDMASRNDMIVANLRLVVALAKRYLNRGLDLLDLVEEGNLGLIRAVQKFNPELGYRFSTYATWWIKQSMDRALTNQVGTVRLPVHIAKELGNCVNIALKLHEQLGREPTPAEIAEVMQRAEQRVREVLGYQMRFCSTDTVLSDTEDLLLIEAIASEDNEPMFAVEDEDLSRSVELWLGRLSEKHREIIVRRYGLRGYHESTLEEVGKAVRLTRERVRQLQIEALLKLRRILEREGLTVACLGRRGTD